MSSIPRDPQFAAAVRRAVYERVVAAVPGSSASDLAAVLGCDREAVRQVLRELAADHVLVLETDGESVLMAPPFSLVPTDFQVRTGQRTYWANCGWDALGIPAALGSPGTVVTRDPLSGEDLALAVDGVQAVGSCWLHLLVPAARFWDDIVFT